MPRVAGKLTQFTQKEVADLFRRARTVLRNPFFNFLIAQQTKEFGRILIVTPRRIGSAPQRNQLKRRIRSIFYEERLFERGYDCIIICKKAATTLTFEQLKQCLLDIFIKLM
jgi:ribonuclease P protein component